MERLDDNPVPAPPQQPRHWWPWAARTFPVGAPVIFQHTFSVDPHPVPANTTGHIVGHDATNEVLYVVIDPPPPYADPGWVTIADHLKRHGVELDDYIYYVSVHDAVWGDLAERPEDRTEGLIWPLEDTWGAPPKPIPKYMLPRSQQRRYKPNPAPTPPHWPRSAAYNVPAYTVQKMRKWMAHTYPPGTPIEFTEELGYSGIPDVPRGARGRVVSPYSDDRLADRMLVEIVDARDATGLQIPKLIGVDVGVSFRNMRPLVDHWATSAGQPIARYLLPPSQRRRFKPNYADDDDQELDDNPVPPPPGGVRASDRIEWVRRTFPVGTPMKLERGDTFAVMSKAEMDKMLHRARHGPGGPHAAVFPHNRLVKLPPDTRATVIEHYHEGRPPRPLDHVFAEVPPPTLGLRLPSGREHELEEAFENWEKHYGNEPMVLALRPLHDFFITSHPAKGRSRQNAVWWPMIDTWGSAPSPLGRHHLPSSQRARLKPNDGEDMTDNPGEEEGPFSYWSEKDDRDAYIEAATSVHRFGRERARELAQSELDKWLEFDRSRRAALVARLGSGVPPRDPRRFSNSRFWRTILDHIDAGAGSIEANKGRGAMQRATFGDDVEDDGGSGAERYEIFHAKDPRRVVELNPRHRFPRKVGLAGDALSVSYRTDKWKQDGDDIDYKHVFEDGVEVFEPWGEQSWLEEAELPLDYPDEPLTLLGQCLGLFLRRVDDDEVYETHMPTARDTWLLCAPDGRMLFVYDPEVGFRAVIAGGALSVEEGGIDH
ncbi:MAG TPA: hypothetical protein VIY27_04315 [Myxococcota bacterium]